MHGIGVSGIRLGFLVIDIENAIKKGEYFISAHSVAETYSVLTNLPLQPRIVPAEAVLIIETNLLACFHRVAVTAKMYERAVLRCAELRAPGGVIYDALLLRTHDRC